MKKLYAIIISLFVATSLYASEFTTKLNLEIPAIGDRNWQPIISKDIISIDTAINILSSDAVWTKSGTAIVPITSTNTVNLTNATNTGTIFSSIGNALTTGYLGYFYSNSADTSGRKLLYVINDNSLAVGAVPIYVQQDANYYCGFYDGIGSLAYDVLYVRGNNLTTGGLAYLYSNSSAVNARNLVSIVNDNALADAAVCLKLQQDGDGNQITGHGDEKLSAAGVWTNRTSTYADKADISPLQVSGYIDKLKNLNLFNYKKKCEIYGNKQDVLSDAEIVQAVDEYDDKYEDIKENGKPTGKRILIEHKLKEKSYRKNINGTEYILDGKAYKKIVGKKYPAKVKHQNARTYQGFILDDPSTPEELISRDNKGKIDGVSPEQGVNFLLAVNKELINRLEKLETRITELEKKL